MLDYMIPLYMGLVFVTFFASVYLFRKAREEKDGFWLVGAFFQAFFSGIFFALSILRTILWVRGL